MFTSISNYVSNVLVGTVCDVAQFLLNDGGIILLIVGFVFAPAFASYIWSGFLLVSLVCNMVKYATNSAPVVFFK